jgi:hypothetical protein
MPALDDSYCLNPFRNHRRSEVRVEPSLAIHDVGDYAMKAISGDWNNFTV